MNSGRTGQPIALVGLRGSGKTALGRALAERLGWEFVDIDSVITQDCGLSICSIFGQRGEAWFREAERAAIAAAVRRDEVVISTGGGAVLHAETRAALRQRATVIWLRCEPQTALLRIEGDPDSGESRPALTGRSPLEELESLLANRAHLYQEIAHIHIATDGLSIREVLEHALKEFERQRPESGERGR